MTKKVKWVGLLLGLVIFASSARVLAAPPEFTQRQPAEVVPSKDRVTVVIPQKAVEVAPGVFELGTTVVDGQVVEGYAFINYRKGFGKPTGCNNDGRCQGWEDPVCADCQGGEPVPDDSSCYGFLAKGAKWRWVEPYVVNPTNTRGLGEAFVTSNLAMDIAKWESAAGVNILGDGSSTSETLVADLESPDNLNEVYFADIDSPGAIAVTIIWGVFGGPPSQRRLVEWDQVYDEVDFDWSSSGEALKMDFENIATHELGHSVGLDDLYEARCSEQTMYGWADYGETKKQTLEAGDIAGVKKLYQ